MPCFSMTSQGCACRSSSRVHESPLRRRLRHTGSSIRWRSCRWRTIPDRHPSFHIDPLRSLRCGLHPVSGLTGPPGAGSASSCRPNLLSGRFRQGKTPTGKGSEERGDKTLPPCIRNPDRAILLQKSERLRPDPFNGIESGSLSFKEVSLGVDPFLLSILVCPKCHGALSIRTNPDGLACPACGLLFPVKDDIPVMLVEEALPLATAGDGRP